MERKKPEMTQNAEAEQDAADTDLDQFEAANPPDPAIEGTTGIEDAE